MPGLGRPICQTSLRDQRRACGLETAQQGEAIAPTCKQRRGHPSLLSHREERERGKRSERKRSSQQCVLMVLQNAGLGQGCRGRVAPVNSVTQRSTHPRQDHITRRGIHRSSACGCVNLGTLHEDDGGNTLVLHAREGALSRGCSGNTQKHPGMHAPGRGRTILGSRLSAGESASGGTADLLLSSPRGPGGAPAGSPDRAAGGR